MLTNFQGSFIVKECWKHPNHKIKIWGGENTNQVYSIQIIVSIKPPLWATWNFLTQDLTVNTVELHKALGTVLPWFEPDISDYRKLVEKIRLYLVFS